MIRSKIFLILLLLSRITGNDGALGSSVKVAGIAFDGGRVMERFAKIGNLENQRKLKPQARKKKKEQFNAVVVTEYDANEASRIFARTGAIDKTSKTNSDRSAYEDLLKKANIARRNEVSLSSVEKADLWRQFSASFNIPEKMDNFCRENRVDNKFLLNFMEDWSLWQKYLSERLRRMVFLGLSENVISDHMEYKRASAMRKKYDLSEMSANYNNDREKKEILKKLDELREKLALGQTEFNSAELGPAKMTELGSIFDDDLSKAVAGHIKSLEVSGVSKPFCSGDYKGSCFIFRMNIKESIMSVDEQRKPGIANAVFDELLKNRVEGMLRDYSGVAMVVHRY
ncbi:MAG: hypothetical protein LBI29_02595 [Rickettsiales bacterium]|jgi:hypothetical protein|nr:hypothetical protein [Rickettsiales bacterium]